MGMVTVSPWLGVDATMRVTVMVTVMVTATLSLRAVMIMVVFVLATGMLTAVEFAPVSLAQALTCTRAQAQQRAQWTWTEGLRC